MWPRLSLGGGQRGQENSEETIGLVQLAGGRQAGRQESTAVGVLSISTKNPNRSPGPLSPTCKPHQAQTLSHLPHVAFATAGLCTYLLKERRGGGKDPGLTIKANFTDAGEGWDELSWF